MPNIVKKDGSVVHVYVTLSEMPDDSREFCASCVMVYVGACYSDEKVQDDVRKAVEKSNDKADWIIFVLPFKAELPLYHAITHAPSWLFPQLGNMPVCANHIMAHGRRNVEESSNLIKGKKHDWKGPDGR